MDIKSVAKEIVSYLEASEAPVHYDVLFAHLSHESMDAFPELNNITLSALGKLCEYGYIVKTGNDYYMLSSHFRLVRETVQSWNAGPSGSVA